MSDALFKQIAAQTQAPHDAILADLITAVTELGRRTDNNIARYLQIITLTIQALERNQIIDRREKAELYKRLEQKTKRRQATVEELAALMHSMTPHPSTQSPRIRAKNPLIEAVTRHSVTEPKVVTKPTKQPVAPWPFPTQPKSPAKPTTPLPKVHVLIRKHPSGREQPTGERRVFRMELIPSTTTIQVGIGEDGKQGWIFDTKYPEPPWITFRLNGSKKASTLQEAWEYWQHNK